MQTVFMQKGFIYCHKLKRTTTYTPEHYEGECVKCPFYNGNLQDGSGIECKFESNTNWVVVGLGDADAITLFEQYGMDNGRPIIAPAKG